MRLDFLRPVPATATGVVAAPAIAVAGLAAGRAFHRGGFHAAAVPLAIAMIAGAALMFAVAAWLRYRRRPVERPTPDPTGSWTRLFGDMIRIIDGLPDDVLARLETRYDGIDDPGKVNKAERTAWALADWYSRIHTHDDGAPTRAQGALGRLFEESTGAYLAALAVLTRDVITLDTFEALTGPWVAEGLPLPGGAGMEHMTLRLEVPSGLAGQWTEIDHATLKGDGTAASAAQLAESLAGHALTHEHLTPDVQEWRLRVWAGLNADTDQPADGEFLYRAATELAEVSS